MFYKHLLLICLLWTVGGQFAHGQGGNSLYSIFGLGDPLPRGNIANAGMGGVGYAYAHPFFSSVKNPALLPISYLTIFDAGYTGERRWIQSDDTQQRDLGGNLAYLSLTFPIIAKGPRNVNRNRWNTSIGLRPITIVNYEMSLTSREGLEGSEAYARYRYQGEGGINEVHFSNGVQINRQLSLGLDINFVFGSISRNSLTNLENTPTLFRIDYQDRSTYSNLTFVPAFAFTDSLVTNHEKGRLYTYTIGGVYRHAYRLNSTRSLTLSTKDFFENTLITDTLLNNASGGVDMPMEIGSGVSISKLYTTKSPLSYTLAADLTFTQWSTYRNTGKITQDGEPERLADVIAIGVGMEIIPDVGSVSNYFKRIMYRFGARYTQTPWMIDGGQIDEFQVSAGASFPLMRQASAINIAGIYGWRGDNTGSQIREDYLLIKIGLTINDRWFVRRKFY